MMNSQLVLVEYKNVEPFVYHIESKDVIDIKSVAKYFSYQNFDEDTDSITFIDDIPSINIDTLEV